MTAQVVHDSKSTLKEQEDFGLCNVVVDATVKKAELVCGRPGVDEILVRNAFGLFVVVLCRPHKEEHSVFYREQARRRHRPRRTSD